MASRRHILSEEGANLIRKPLRNKINRENQWYHFHRISFPNITLKEEWQLEPFLPGTSQTLGFLPCFERGGSAKRRPKAVPDPST